MKVQIDWHRYKPALSKQTLLILAGGMWSAVGILLLNFARQWLSASWQNTHFLLVLGAIVGAFLAYRWMFRAIALKNIARIRGLGDKVCGFAFQAWKGYLIIIFMMTGGILLRQSAVPKAWLSVVYIIIGGALLISSFQYYLNLRQPYIN